MALEIKPETLKFPCAQRARRAKAAATAGTGGVGEGAVEGGDAGHARARTGSVGGGERQGRGRGGGAAMGCALCPRGASDPTVPARGGNAGRAGQRGRARALAADRAAAVRGEAAGRGSRASQPFARRRISPPPHTHTPGSPRRPMPRDRAAGLNPEMLAGGGASAGVGAPPSPVAANRLEISPSLTRAQPLPPPCPLPLARPLSATHTHPVPARSCAPAPAVELRKQIRCDLFLRNAGSTAVAFKVKTTAPKKYCVRPNIGIVAPGATVEVQVIMQSQKEQPADLAACRDKFLVQSVETTAAEASQLDASTFQKAEGKTIGESKLRVAYTTPAMPPTVSEEGLASPMATPAGRAAANNGGGGATYDNDLDAATMNYKASQVRVRARRRRRRSRVRAREGGVGGRAGRRADAPPCREPREHHSLAVPHSPPFPSQAEVSRMQREISDYKLQVSELKSKAAAGQDVAGKPSGFSMLHLLLTAIICFLIGRFM